KLPGWRYPSDQWVQQCQHLLKQDARLSAVLHGDVQPENVGEQLQLAELCHRYKKRYVTAVRFYSDAFAAGAALTSRRAYEAAHCAVLTADGKGKDGPKLSDKEKAALRQQALSWLKEALKVHRKHREDKDRRKEVRQTLQHWQQDPDLSSVRDKE